VRPLDPRAHRFDQAAAAFVLLCGFVGDWPPIAMLVGLALAAGAAFGPRYGPFLRLYEQVVAPRLPPVDEREDPRPPRFAATAEAVLLVAATVAFAAGASGVGWALTLAVAAHAGLVATAGICPAGALYRRRAGYVRSPQ
jgi:uncharacterized protein DUF4395